MLVTWRSTAATVTTISLAMPEFERPSAMSAMTCLSRGVRPSSGLRQPFAPYQPRDHVGIEYRPALGYPPHRVGERPHVADLFFQQVADTLSAVRHEVERIRVLEILGQDEHAHSRRAGPDGQRGPEAVVAVVRGHLDVGDDDVRVVDAVHPDQVARVGGRAEHLEAAVLEDAYDPFPDKWLVFADDDANCPVRVHGTKLFGRGGRRHGITEAG